MKVPSLNSAITKTKLETILAVYSTPYSYHIEQYPVVDGELMPSEALSEDKFKEVCRELKLINKTRIKEAPLSMNGFIPHNLIYSHIERRKFLIVFKEPPQKRYLRFTEESGLIDGYYDIPGIIYFYVNKTLWVYCYDKWLGNKTKLYAIVLPNINIENCSVCMGNVTIPHFNSVQEIVTQIPIFFWNSYFNEFRSNEIDEEIEALKNNKIVIKKKFYKNTLINIINDTLS